MKASKSHNLKSFGPKTFSPKSFGTIKLVDPVVTQAEQEQKDAITLACVWVAVIALVTIILI